MCGIFCCVCNKGARGCKLLELLTPLILEQLQHRGPDARGSHKFELRSCDVALYGTVLQMRGPVTPQPAVDVSNGDALLWNGEVFGGLELKEGENDTAALLDTLGKCDSVDDLLNVFRDIRGPWAMAYYQASTMKLWFGRDIFGRRSLLWHLPASEEDFFALSSVASTESMKFIYEGISDEKQFWTEVPSLGLFSIDLKHLLQPGSMGLLKCYPWMQGGEPYHKDVYPYLENISRDPLVVCVNKKETFTVSFPCLNKTIPEGARIDSEDHVAEDKPTHGGGSSTKRATVPSDSTEGGRSQTGSRVLPFKDSTTYILYSAPCQSKKSQSPSCKEKQDREQERQIQEGEAVLSVNPGIQDRKPSVSSAQGEPGALQPKTECLPLSRALMEAFAPVQKTVPQLASGSSIALNTDKRMVDAEHTMPKATSGDRPVTTSAAKGDHPVTTATSSDHPVTTATSGDSTLSTATSAQCKRSNPVNLASSFRDVLCNSVHRRVHNLPHVAGAKIHNNCLSTGSRLGILFSGGVDSVVMAALADMCFPKDEPIDLINVAFDKNFALAKTQPKKGKGKKSAKDFTAKGSSQDNSNYVPDYNVPDRILAISSLKELNSERPWNLILVNVQKEEAEVAREAQFRHLVYPLQTVLDDSIGCALWFAARGRGVLYNREGGVEEQPCISSAKGLLVGIGADEQLAGYSRHRTMFATGGYAGLLEEVDLDIHRISVRNLGRDDRCVADHMREARFPFLDEDVVSFLQQLSIDQKVDMSLPRGEGEKKLLRDVARLLGCPNAGKAPKQAIQFGSRSAKVTGERGDKGSQVCKRLGSSDRSAQLLMKLF